ncbi:OsmC family protein [Gallaecimonas mangrovi]|uniref:OsmC family protein n=1 Tax=Gallaecimonas mangrovi TaxID=2291597 RepID=UPI000E202423|nr:OsmC family protein [Gallaecimonas mangrovi]
MALEISLKADWNGGVDGKGRIVAEDAAFDIAIPKPYGGAGTDTHPKELLVAAAQACFLATLRGITAMNKLPVEHLSVETKAEAGDTFKISHQAEITLPAGSGEAEVTKAEALLEKADAICEVGNLVRKAGVQITMIPTVKIA